MTHVITSIASQMPIHPLASRTQARHADLTQILLAEKNMPQDLDKVIERILYWTNAFANKLPRPENGHCRTWTDIYRFRANAPHQIVGKEMEAEKNLPTNWQNLITLLNVTKVVQGMWGCFMRVRNLTINPDLSRNNTPHCLGGWACLTWMADRCHQQPMH